MKTAHQIAAENKDTQGANVVAESKAIAKDQIWQGDGYTKYTFDDNSVLIQSGMSQYAMDADDAESIRGYAEFLDAEAAAAEADEIQRLLEALSE